MILMKVPYENDIFYVKTYTKQVLSLSFITEAQLFYDTFLIIAEK